MIRPALSSDRQHRIYDCCGFACALGIFTDPRIPLDNNAAERALRGPVVGRKNRHGSRSLRGTQVAALFYSLCEAHASSGSMPTRI